MEETIGKKKIKVTKKEYRDKETKQKKQQMKEKKKKYEIAVKEEDGDPTELYEDYIGKREELREAIKKHQKERTKRIADQLIKEGGVKSKNFWHLRNKLLKKDKPEYDLITEQDVQVEKFLIY